MILHLPMSPQGHLPPHHRVSISFNFSVPLKVTFPLVVLYFMNGIIGYLSFCGDNQDSILATLFVLTGWRKVRGFVQERMGKR